MLLSTETFISICVTLMRHGDADLSTSHVQGKKFFFTFGYL